MVAQHTVDEVGTKERAGRDRIPALPPSATAPALPPPAARARSAANPLLAAATPVLMRLTTLAGLPEHPAPPSLRAELLADLRRFVEAAAAAGCDPGCIRAGRFALAATIDDVLGATPWGGRTGWIRRGVSAEVDRGGGGPAAFFNRLTALLSDADRNRPAIELFSVCLSLGFAGSLRHRPDGDGDRERLRAQLHRLLQARRGAAPHGLAPPVAPPCRRRVSPRNAGRHRLAAIAVGSLALASATLYAGLLLRLAPPAIAVAGRLDAMVPEGPVGLDRPPPPPATAGPDLVARVGAALEPEIRTGAVVVLAGTDGALVIRVPAATMFPVDGDTVAARGRAVFDRIGQALAVEAGLIAVVAHTDDRTVHSARFADAAALTQARADAVAARLEAHVAAARLSAVGRGDSEPLAANDSLAHRAANRRIDIRLYPF